MTRMRIRGAEPDHGEVCGLAWDCTVEDDGLNMRTHGVRFPYTLEKRVHFKAPGVLHLVRSAAIKV